MDSLDVCEQDYLDFFGMTFGEVYATHEHSPETWQESMRDVFNSHVTDTRSWEQIFNFYNSMENTSWTFLPGIGNFEAIDKEYPRILALDDPPCPYHVEVINQWAKTPGKTMLDYGCGCAASSIWVASQGLDVTLADLPIKGFKFLEYITNKYRPGIKFLDITSDYLDLGGPYDFIYCSEVLEHVIEPFEVLKNLVKHLKHNGEMYLTTFFYDCEGVAPQHLKHNVEAYGVAEVAGENIAACGLALIGVDRNSPKIFRNVGIDAPGLEASWENIGGVWQAGVED